MNQYKEKFTKRKEEIMELLENTRLFYDRHEFENKSAIFKDIMKNVEEDEFSIVLVGEFSAGKSTFLNALMGERLLPSFTNETTATINYLRHKEKAQNGEAGIVYFKDGTTKVLDTIDFSIISNYVSTESEIGVVREVDHLDLFLDSKFLEGNVTLVDSPGLNGIADFHRDVTENQIEKSNASIFMFKANQPGSETDFKFLEQLRTRVKTIIFALNKIDDIKSSEGETPESVVNKLKESYRKKFPEDNEMPEIWGISAYQALVARSNEALDYRDRNDYTKAEKKTLEEASRMIAFEDRLWRFMTQGEKARAMLSAPIEKVVSNLTDTKKDIENERSILNNSVDSTEIEEDILKIQNQIEEMEMDIKNATANVSSDVGLIAQEVKDSFENKFEKVKSKNIKKLDEWNDISELNEFESRFVSKIEREYREIIAKCEDEFKSRLRDVIVENYEEVVGVVNENLQGNKFEINIDTKFESEDINVNIGIENYEKEIENLQEELKKKDEEAKASGRNFLQATIAENEKEEILRQINVKEREKIEYANMYTVSKEYQTRDAHYTRERNGVFGKVAQFFCGEKEYTSQETVVVNQDEVIRAETEKERVREEYAEKLNELNNELARGKGHMSVQEAEFLDKQIKVEQEKLREAIIQRQAEFKAEFMKKNAVALKKRKYELEDYFDELFLEVMSVLSKELSNSKEIYVSLIKKQITDTLNAKLENKKRECEILKEKLDSSIEEKKENLAKLEVREEELKGLLETAIRIKFEVESEEVDTIKEIL